MLKRNRLSLSKETLKNLTPDQGAPVLGTPEMREVVGGSFIICTGTCASRCATCADGDCHTRFITCAPCNTAGQSECQQCPITSHVPGCPPGGCHAVPVPKDF